MKRLLAVILLFAIHAFAALDVSAQRIDLVKKGDGTIVIYYDGGFIKPSATSLRLSSISDNRISIYIDGKEQYNALVGNVTVNGVQLTAANYDSLTDGINVISGGGGGGGGVTDYSQLTGLPSIEGHKLVGGNQDASYLGLATATQVAGFDTRIKADSLRLDATAGAIYSKVRADSLVLAQSGGGDVNIIDTVKVNGTALSVTNKAVDVTKASLGLGKGDVGLGNVDNTADSVKPVSTAQKTALDAKADTTLLKATATAIYAKVRADSLVVYAKIKADSTLFAQGGGGGSDTAAVWGRITGHLSDQRDLDTAFVKVYAKLKADSTAAAKTAIWDSIKGKQFSKIAPTDFRVSGDTLYSNGGGGGGGGTGTVTAVNNVAPDGSGNVTIGSANIRHNLTQTIGDRLKIDSANTTVVPAHDFGTAVPSQSAINDYIASTKVALRNGLEVRNLFDNSLWLYGNQKEKGFYYFGGSVIPVASDSTLGIVQGSKANYEVHVKDDGTMSVNGMGAKVDSSRKVAGKSLSKDITLAKGDVGLGSVDNTSDTGKPVSTAQKTALDAKADTALLKATATAIYAKEKADSTTLSAYTDAKVAGAYSKIKADSTVLMQYIGRGDANLNHFLETSGFDDGGGLFDTLRIPITPENQAIDCYICLSGSGSSLNYGYCNSLQPNVSTAVIFNVYNSRISGYEIGFANTIGLYRGSMAYIAIRYDDNSIQTVKTVDVPIYEPLFFDKPGRLVTEIAISYNASMSNKPTEFLCAVPKTEKPTFNNIQRADSVHDGLLRKEDFVKFSGGGGGGAVTMATDSVLGLVRGTRISNKKNEKGVGNIEYNIHIKEDGEMSVEELSDDIDELWDGIHKVDSAATSGNADFQKFLTETGYQLGTPDTVDAFLLDPYVFKDSLVLNSYDDLEESKCGSECVYFYQSGRNGFTGHELGFNMPTVADCGGQEQYFMVTYENPSIPRELYKSSDWQYKYFPFKEGERVSDVVIGCTMTDAKMSPIEFRIAIPAKYTFTNMQMADETHDGLLRMADFKRILEEHDAIVKVKVFESSFPVGGVFLTTVFKGVDEVTKHFSLFGIFGTVWKKLEKYSDAYEVFERVNAP
ncbi:hypothetical protein Barb4_02074 [Bacteroidales bacterium Barb4]|nr:hypothetical protein Barb4_02074 [Bacteroidales bacterium Barb4]